MVERPQPWKKIADRLHLSHENDFRICSGNNQIAINRYGGKVIYFGPEGFNFLTGQDINEINFGSTLWPSPQKSWNEDGWPPPKTLDRGYYHVEEVGDNKIRLRSHKDRKT